MPVLVVVNPGHSDTDSGAIGPTGLRESEVTLHLAHALLARGGGEVLYWGRRQEPGKQGLGRLLVSLLQNQPPMLLSLHCNAYEWSPGKCLHRAEFYHWARDPDTARRSHSASLSSWLVRRATGEGGYAERAEPRTAPYYRLDRDGSPYLFTPAILHKKARLAAALVEIGYISDPHVEAAMRTRDWVRRAAGGLDRGIRECVAELNQKGGEN